MRLTKTTGHAIRILMDCATADGERTKVASVAGRLGISQLNAFKIVHILSKAGFIDAMRGRNGGVKLAMPPEDIRIGAIVREIEATDVEVAGANGSGKRREQAPINAIFDEALDAFISVLDRHSLADMAPLPKRGKRRSTPDVPVARLQGKTAASLRTANRSSKSVGEKTKTAKATSNKSSTKVTLRKGSRR